MNLKLNLEGMRRVASGHPWVRRQDLVRGAGGSAPDRGQVCRLQDATGNFLAHAAYEGKGRDPLLRVLSRERHPGFGADWVALRLEWALDWRGLGAPGSQASSLRLVHGEADNLPGIYADFCGGALLLEIQSPAMEPHAALVEEELCRRLMPTAVWSRRDGEWQSLRGPGRAEFHATQDGLRHWVRLKEAEPADFDLEGAAERERLSQWKGRFAGKAALLLFSRGGAWAAAALKQGAASALMVDKDHAWLERAAQSLALNKLEAEAWHADAFRSMDKLAAQGRRFGLLVLDCPASAKSAAGHFRNMAGWVKAASRASGLLEPDGLLVLRLKGAELDLGALSRELEKAGMELLAGPKPGPGFREMRAWPEGWPGLQVAAAKKAA